MSQYMREIKKIYSIELKERTKHHCNINCTQQSKQKIFKIHVASFTEPSATKNYIGSPNNNATNFPEIYENPLHRRQKGTAFLIRFQNEQRNYQYILHQINSKEEKSAHCRDTRHKAQNLQILTTLISFFKNREKKVVPKRTP